MVRGGVEPPAFRFSGRHVAAVSLLANMSVCLCLLPAQHLGTTIRFETSTTPTHWHPLHWRRRLMHAPRVCTTAEPMLRNGLRGKTISSLRTEPPEDRAVPNASRNMPCKWLQCRSRKVRTRSVKPSAQPRMVRTHHLPRLFSQVEAGVIGWWHRLLRAGASGSWTVGEGLWASRGPDQAARCCSHLVLILLFSRVNG